MHSSISNCPRFAACSAPLCPLDPLWYTRVMLRGDRVCRYLSEAVKSEAFKRFSGVTDEYFYKQAMKVLPEFTAAFSVLRRRLLRSSKTESRIEISRRLLKRNP